MSAVVVDLPTTLGQLAQSWATAVDAALTVTPIRPLAWFLAAGQWTAQSVTAPDPLYLAVAVCATTTLVLCWIPSVLTKHYSFVDRLWSFMPVVYTGIFTAYAIRDAYPVVYAAHHFDDNATTSTSTLATRVTHVGLVAADLVALRPVVQFLLVLAWGARLTYNYYRKGGYRWPSEDYRWEFVQRIVAKLTPFAWFNALVWQVFNFAFIAVFQNVLLLALSYPAYLTWQIQHAGLKAGETLFQEQLALVSRLDPEHSRTLFSQALLTQLQSMALAALSRPHLLDGLVIMLWLGLLVGEFVADQQQWNFHQIKARFQSFQQWHRNQVPATGAEVEATLVEPTATIYRQDVRRGFLTNGLFAYSRHPNFFCEISLWWTLTLFVPCAWLARQQILNTYASAVAADPLASGGDHRILDGIIATLSQLGHLGAPPSLFACDGWRLWQVMQWCLMSPLALTALFQGSTALTEFISCFKYPDYAAYQRVTSRLIPWRRSQPLPPPQTKDKRS
ncbi:hypothetical protein H4R35_000633 [Dimargaris xerosporica]|nr:hypothetical protein H4R35_000633 [Dimargaris xerosporica]